MNSNFRKIVILILVAAMLCLCLAGCAKTGICDGCDQKCEITKYVCDDGEVLWFCDDCVKWAKFLGY